MEARSVKFRAPPDPVAAVLMIERSAGTGVGVRVGVLVGVRVGVRVAVEVRVRVSVGVGVTVGVEVLVGVGVGAAETVTLSKAEVQATVLLWLVTARPIKTLAAIGIVAVPTEVQLIPSAEMEAVKVLPLRARRTQYGATGPATVVPTAVAPVVSRCWNAAPEPGVTNISAYVESAARLSRIITPALAHTLVF